MSSNFIQLGQQRNISLWSEEFDKELGEYEYLLHLPEFSAVFGGRKTQLVGISIQRIWDNFFQDF